jgi:DNA-binding NarL/FixJ family response regulator
VIEVVVVAAYPMIRAGLRALLEATADCSVVGEAASVAEGAALASRVEPEIVLLDVRPAEASDLAELASLGHDQPDVGLVALLDASEERYLPGLARGRLGYLPRDAAPELILQAVRAVASGLVVLAPRVVPSLVVAPRRAAAPTTQVLTARELEVLALLAQGLPNKAIALRLAISEHTVKFHVGAILGKLGAASRTEAVMLAARQGLLML